MDLTILRNHVFNRLRQVPHLMQLPEVDDIDDILNHVQETYIQPVAKVEGIVDVELPAEGKEWIEPQHFDGVPRVFAFEGFCYIEDIAKDVYEIAHIRDITKGLPGLDVPLLDFADNWTYEGVQEYSGMVYFRNIPNNTLLRFQYFKKLRPLGTGEEETTVPDIDPRWHDLYWMGAVGQYSENILPLFMDRLERFDRERTEKTGQPVFRLKPNW